MDSQKEKRQLAARLKTARHLDQRTTLVAAVVVTPKGQRYYLTHAEMADVSQSRIARLTKAGGKFIPINARVPRKVAKGCTPRSEVMLGKPIDAKVHPELYEGEHELFTNICLHLGIEPTDRQFVKKRAGRGEAFHRWGR